MTTIKQLRQTEKLAREQRGLVLELETLAKDIDRCDRTITQLQAELGAINEKFQGPRDTRQDIEYLSGLLNCAKKKLVWEKHMASLQKRTPDILARISAVVNDPNAPADDPARAALADSLVKVQQSMERLQRAKG